MSKCIHCDEDILVPVFNDLDVSHLEPFCCLGCLTVFNVITAKGLEKYYEIKKDSAIFKRRSPVESKPQRFSFLDSEEFQNEYSYVNLHSERTMEFYLEGIHCLACLWLIEKLPEYLDDAVSCRLDMQKSVVVVSINKSGKFSHVARELNNLGYRPHALKRSQDVHELKKKEERKMLLKIGIAGAGAGNIMLYAVSNYAGAKGTYAEIFNLLTVVFALPVFFYSATPFYKSAWNAIRNKQISIDIPIAMSLIMGLVMGLYNLINGTTDNYFDSLTALVFLLLLSRYFLNKIQESGLSANDLNFFYEGTSVLKKEGSNFVETHPQYIKAGDILKININEMIPADGRITSGQSLINSSLLTGESKPETVKVNDQVYSGTINLSHAIEMEVEKTKDDSRIGKILKQVENGWTQKSHIVELTNVISKYFIAVVLLLSASLFIYFIMKGQTHLALERALTLLIVTCPCALAIATPLTLTRTLARSAKKGMIIKNNEVIEKLSKVKTVYFDKTGTLTFGALKVAEFNYNTDISNPYDIIFALEKTSQHPAAIALKEFAATNGIENILAVDQYKEVLGSGVSGIILGDHYEIKPGIILKNEMIVATFSLVDQLRPDSKEAVKKLKEKNLQVEMLSGDQTSVAYAMGIECGLKTTNIHPEMSPEMKLQTIEKNPDSLMVGDGANDAMALSRSFVSVAVMGSLDITLRASDIYLTTPGISTIPDLLVISKETMKVIRRNLVLSLLYNSLSVYAAFAGFISPLVAAIIMPLSSLTVLISTLVGTKELNDLLKIRK